MKENKENVKSVRKYARDKKSCLIKKNFGLNELTIVASCSLIPLFSAYLCVFSAAVLVVQIWELFTHLSAIYAKMLFKLFLLSSLHSVDFSSGRFRVTIQIFFSLFFRCFLKRNLQSVKVNYNEISQQIEC